MKLIGQYFPILLLIFLITSCKEKNAVEEEIGKIDLNLDVHRFDIEFAEANPHDLTGLKLKYPYLFPTQYPDSIWISKMQDTLQSELELEAMKVFPTFEAEKEQLKDFFRHVKYYFPQVQAPKIVTLISEVRYEERVILTDSLLLIGLDNYLGSDHKFYAGLPNYVSKGLQKQFLISDVASAFSKKVNTHPRERSFLSRMVYYGKELFLKDKLIPQASDAQKINYSEEEYTWAEANEEQIWRYFVENELLYSTDFALDRKFLDPAPFSKFGLELDSESPSRLGRYIGWKIVRAFADQNSDVELQELLQLPADEIFKKSNYKPKR